MTSATERVIKARCGLLIREPFFGTLSLRLELVETRRVETMAVNGRQLFFNPEWITSIHLTELEGVIAHEVMHCAMLHHLRRSTRELKEWNDATDYAINSELLKAGFQLPDGALINSRFDGRAAESIYDELIALKQQSGWNPSDGQVSPSNSTDAAGDPDPSSQTSGGKGKSATGTVEDAVDEQGDQLSESETVSEENEWQQAVSQAAQASRGAGHELGSVERALQSTLQPKVNWREALQRLMMSKTKDDYNWGKPNRRLLPMGLYFPSMDSPRCGILGFAVDGSGSIRQREYDQFTAEIEDAVRMLRPEKIIVMVFDTAVREVFEFEPDQPIKLIARAGGGTRFDGPVIKLKELAIFPEVLVYLTDLDSGVFPEEPDYPVIWVTTRSGRVPFGEVIEM